MIPTKNANLHVILLSQDWPLSVSVGGQQSSMLQVAEALGIYESCVTHWQQQCHHNLC